MNTSVSLESPRRVAPGADPVLDEAKTVYLALRDEAGRIGPRSRAFLDRALAQARTLPCDLPADPAGLDTWCTNQHARVGHAYREYLAERHSSGRRRYFPTRAAALYFLRGAAPTKLVDGAWLYGVLPRWGDAAWHGLIRTYLEELGDGVEDQNHVALYQGLLARHGCDQFEDLADANFVQGAIQLALAAHGECLLPEVAGFNLGYEQLPLHLLITAYELNELGIDPYYFTVHVTVDNAASGHARRAVESVRQLAQRAADPADFWRRVGDGYRLNALGASTGSIIASFDLDAELKRILVAKGAVGKHLHSDYCRIEGRAVSDWLRDEADIPALLDAFERTGWIVRGQAAEDSRFWELVSGPRAQMFGVFSGYELQVLRDWIEHDPAAVPARVASFRARQRVEGNPVPARAAPRGLIREQAADDADALRQFELRVAAAGSKRAMMDLLIAQMGPARHHTPMGLMATRMFAQLLVS